jgi:hypothetical protein
MRISNAHFRMPVYPDPPAAIHPEPVPVDMGVFGSGKQSPSVTGSASGPVGMTGLLSDQYFTALAGVGHFANAVPSAYRPNPFSGYAVELRVASFELDCRALDNKFDVSFTVAPVNINVPEAPTVDPKSTQFAGVTAMLSRGGVVPTTVSTTLDAGIGGAGRPPVSRTHRSGQGRGSDGPSGFGVSGGVPTRAAESSEGLRLARSLQIATTYFHLQSFAGRWEAVDAPA